MDDYVNALHVFAKSVYGLNIHVVDCCVVGRGSVDQHEIVFMKTLTDSPTDFASRAGN
jgi:hypothetical protein